MGIIDKLKFLISKDYNLSDPGWSKLGMLTNYFSNGRGVTKPMAQNSVVYTCVSKIASNITQAKIKFYFDGDKLVPENNAINILFKRPYPNITSSGFVEISASHFALYGECFWFLVSSVGQSKGMSNLPSQIIPLLPALMSERIDQNKGELIGWVYNNKIPMSLDEVIHVKNTNVYNPFRGLSPLDAIKADMDADYLASIYQKNFFVNGASPQTVFTTPVEDGTTPEQGEDFIKKWNAKYQGVDNSNKAALLSAGMDVKNIGLTQNEMNFVDCRRYASTRIMSAFGVPPPVAGEMENANYSNMKSAKQSFWDDTLQNYLNKFEDSINSYITWPFDKSMTMKFDLSKVAELSRNDKDVADLIAIYSDRGVPINTLNQVFNNPIPPVEGGDIGYRNISMIADGEDRFAEPTPVAAPKEEPKAIDFVEIKQIENKSDNKIEKTVRSRFLNDKVVAERLFKKELKQYWFNQQSKILRKLNGGKSNEDPTVSTIMTNINIWEQEKINLKNRFLPVFNIIAELAGKSALENLSFDSEGFKVSEEIVKNRIEILVGINNTTHEAIKTIVENGVEKGLSIPQIGQVIKEYYGDISKTRSLLIARTETSSLMNAQQLDTYKGKGVTKKRWTGGTRPTHAAVNGIVIGMDEKFTVGNSKLMYPGDMTASAKETLNCTCCLTPYIE